MNWLITSSLAGKELYELRQDGQKLLTLEYHPFTNSARLVSAKEQRVFHIRKEGFLRNKTVLRNEYGIKLGQLAYDKSQPSEGTLLLDDEKFQFKIEKTPQASVKIYKQDNESPLVECGLETENGITEVKVDHKKELSPSEHFLLLSLCWYLLVPAAIVDYPEPAL